VDKKEWIKAFLKAGFTLIPLKGKIPVEKNWPQTPYGKWNETNLDGNYGVVLTNRHVIVDVDRRNFAPGDNPLKRLTQRLKIDLRSSFIVKTGGGGLHIYLRKPTYALVRGFLADFPGIEFKSKGRQVVGPGSIHPTTGEIYLVIAGQPSQIRDIPSALLELIKAGPIKENEKGTGEYKDSEANQKRFVDFLRSVAHPSIEGQGGDDNVFKVACGGRDLGLSPKIVLELLFKEWNPRCKPPWPMEDLILKVQNAYRYATGSVGSAHPAADFTAISQNGTKFAPSWVTDKNGAPTKCFQNLVNFFNYEKYGLKNVFGYNEFANAICFLKSPPWQAEKIPLNTNIQDHDIKQLKGYLAVKCGFEMSVQLVHEALINVAHEHSFHPVRDWLSKLQWDGKKRLDVWLSRYLGVEDTPYVQAVGRKTLCAAVKRVLQPGCKFDHVLVLEGPQDFGKSAVCRILGGEWAADFPVDPHQKDTIQLMQGKWIIEMAELEVFRRTDIDALKAFLTRPVDEARLAYQMVDRKYPRQFIFIATYNPRGDGTYLLDETGNRRWWPIRCSGRQVDFKTLEKDRNQLWAETYHQTTVVGEDLYMNTEELRSAAKIIVSDREPEAPWAERIGIWLQGLKEAGILRNFLTAREIFIDAMQGIDKQFQRKEQISIAQAMRALGWEPYVKREGDRFIRGYQNGAKPYSIEQADRNLLGDLL
jgi:predicted P-loop ATPase